MKWAMWLRRFVDELMYTPYLRSLERQLAFERLNHHERLAVMGEIFREDKRALETGQLELRQDLTERIRDKDAVIADLRVRLAIAETDAMRERIEKQKRAAPKPVPDFGGPVSFQDELAAMTLEVTEEDNAVS